MSARELRDSLAWLGLSQSEASRLLGVKLRTVQRWAAGRPPVAEPAAQALRAWRRLAESGFAWRPDSQPVEVENLVALIEYRRAALGLTEILRLSAGQRDELRWRVNIARCRATCPTMVVYFDRLTDGSFLPASYRRLRGPDKIGQSQLQEVTIAFLDAIAKRQKASSRRLPDSRDTGRR